MATLTIDDETAEVLRARAAAFGITLDAYLRDVALHARPTPVPLIFASRPKRRMTPEEREQWWRDLASGEPVAASLPPDFSRADLYEDDDR